MKVLFFAFNGKEEVGVLSKDGKGVYPLSAMGLNFTSVIDFIEAYDNVKNKVISGLENEPKAIALEEIKMLSPIPQPKHDILCLGLNYKAHVEEFKHAADNRQEDEKQPVYFTKRASFVLGGGAEIPSHSDITKALDYEAELAIIIGKQCKNVKKQDVFDYIFGYSISNDVTARDLQKNHVQFTFGKGLDGFAVVGPWIVTEDEFDRPPVLGVKSIVNGEVRQDSSTGLLIYDIPYIISQLSSGITLYPGDIILTGTPGGVGFAMDPPKVLKTGDTVECVVENIGVLRNTIGE